MLHKAPGKSFFLVFGPYFDKPYFDKHYVLYSVWASLLILTRGRGVGVAAGNCCIGMGVF